ncbi:MAG: SDR family NAD(P)-dependent oxidoreductase [Methanoregula sp.]|nr:SDR family NAD(P)-dependent oxidoreductase [Methanoregula sp.]
MKKSSHHLVVITGATRGLGRLVADRFWQAGDDLILVARQESGLKKVARDLSTTRQPDQQVHYFAADLSNLIQISSLIDTIQKIAGNPDILINNAAIQGPIGPIHINDWTEWQECLNVCLLTPVQLCRGFLPSMIECRYGRIVNISGGGATAPRPNFSSYATAKCGVVRFSETLAHEVASYGITVNCVAPGAMMSRLTEKILDAGIERAGSSEIENAQQISKENPQAEKRAADLVHFLTTDSCNQINGKLISAMWDPWEKLPYIAQDIRSNDVYTLRRIRPKERNLTFE